MTDNITDRFTHHLTEAEQWAEVHHEHGEATAHAAIAQAIATERAATALEGLLLVLDTRGEVSAYLEGPR